MRDSKRSLFPLSGIFLTTALLIVGCTEAPLTPSEDDPAFARSRGPQRAVASYVFAAGRWGRAQTNAVNRAGGRVTFSHAASGVGIATSSAPDFLDDALASGAFTVGAQDQLAQWQPPTQYAGIHDAAITPGDEPEFPIQWNMEAIEAPAAWAAGCTGSGVRIAIVDGGIDSDHPDLAPNLDFGASASFVPPLPWDFDNGEGGFWHATHVAGIAAAADNGFGVIGVAPEATLIGVKVLDAGGGFVGAILQGIIYASTAADADIINLSLGLTFPKDGSQGLAQLASVVTQVVNFATSQGVLVISAVGNDGLNFDHSFNFIVSPAESGNGIAISATGPVDFANGGTNYRRFASYSNYGHSMVNLAAPGGDFTLFPNGAWFLDMVRSTNQNNTDDGFSWAAGTSMAAPAAAGVAALIKQRYPRISVGALKNKLANTADDEGKPGHDAMYGRGFVNARRACTG